ncbi:hypothetical protein KSX_95660 [Ktedonospora formicarum]|uniref:Uncharacterized protein n=2 Tax=Ktedonospora formicarum TaxID=2778364 RepID=A0A8J3MZ30_9CHLR|nr:hypothetical protein KSX_95660 [Ktedonospora formicarum]
MKKTSEIQDREQTPQPAVEDVQPTKAQIIAAILDEPDMESVDWAALMGEGVVVRVHIRRVRFRKRLTFADLGLHFPTEEISHKMHEMFRLGMKNLLPRNYLDRIEQIEYRARKLVTARSYETIWGPFIPVTAYIPWREEMRQLELDYYQVRDDLLRDYPAIRKQILTDYVLAARQSYRILHQLHPDALTERERLREIFYLAGVRHKIRQMLPSAEDIMNTFEFTVSPTYIDLPLLAGAEMEAMPGAEAPLDKVTIEGITPQEQRELRWLQAGTKERQRMMREMNEDVVRRAREQKEQQIDLFFTTIISQLRGLLYDATTNVLASLKTRERLQPRAVVQLKNLVEHLQQLNFYGDRDVEIAMRLIKDLVDRPREKRDLALIDQRLRQIATVMRSTLLALEDESREEREDDEKRGIAGVSRKPSRTEVREARLELGFSIPSWEEEREERQEEDAPLLSLPVAEEREERSWP